MSAWLALRNTTLILPCSWQHGSDVAHAIQRKCPQSRYELCEDDYGNLKFTCYD